MRYAPSIRIAKQLVSDGADVIGYDPVAEPEAEKILSEYVAEINSQ